MIIEERLRQVWERQVWTAFAAHSFGIIDCLQAQQRIDKKVIYDLCNIFFTPTHIQNRKLSAS